MDANETTQVPPPRSGTTTMPPKARVQPPQDKPESFPPRQQTIIDLGAIVLIPLSVRAALDEAGKPDNQISPWTLTVTTVASSLPPLAKAVDNMTEQYPQLGVMLDRIGAVTPFAEVVSVLMTMGLQIAENFGRLPAAVAQNAPGVIPRQEYAEALIAQARAKQNGQEAA